MKCNHKIVYRNSNQINECPNKSIDLVVTSPPYPMIEMWDSLFSSLNPEIMYALKKEDRMSAYNLMNEELNKVWGETDRCLKNGGIICINIGDATRKIGESFQLYANHSKITTWFENKGYSVLPPIIWRKTSNKPNKYMGSGMLPTSAYVTLEHEYILVFRKGLNRVFKFHEKTNRQQSAYFWEERNIWFSDVWTDLKGATQKLNDDNLRTRSAAYPFELAYRLINMYSVHGDTVLDPFAGTGTTALASMCLARNSINYEIDHNFDSLIKNKISNIKSESKTIIYDRLKKHMEFARIRTLEKGDLKHKSEYYGFKVMTTQEKNIIFPIIDDIININENEFEVIYLNEIPNFINEEECVEKNDYLTISEKENNTKQMKLIF